MNIELDMSKKDQIAQYLRGRIQSNYYPAGKRLESVREIAKDFDVSLKIVTDALSNLEKEGLVRREAGRGVFVENGKKLLFVFVGNDIEAPYHYFSPGVDERVMERRLRVERIACSFIRANCKNKKFVARFAENYFGIIYDGFFVVGTEPEVKLFQDSGLPVVMPHSMEGDNISTGFFAMHPDFRAAHGDALRFIRSKGHTRIGTISFNTETHIRGYTKKEYQQFLENLGCDSDPELIFPTAYDRAAIGDVAEKILQMREPPTALMCISDFFAMHVMNALRERGLKLPDDMSVMGFCCYPGGNVLDPPLSTVDLEYFNAGKLAVDFVCGNGDWMKKLPEERFFITPHKIVERKSVVNHEGGCHDL